MPETLRTPFSADTTAATPSADPLADMGLRHHLKEFVTEERTLYRIAKDAGISTNSIYKLSGDPTASMSWPVLAKLCAALNCQPGELLSYEPDAIEG